MKEFLAVLLQAVATAAIPVCTAFLVRFLYRKTDQIVAETDHLDTKDILKQVTDAVATAVTYTSQTYVDTLKKNGVFNTEAQMDALQLSKEKALSLLSDAVKKILTELYGDLDSYLVTKIEAEVRNQKLFVSSVESED